MDRTPAFLLIVVLLVAGCSSGPKPIVVGSKNFTEQVLLGEIVAQQIERTLKVRVERKLNLGGTLLAHEAVRTGDIDLYPEYTGTALTAVLQRPAGGDSTTVLDVVRQGYRQWALAWLNPFGFNNTFAMVVRTDEARKSGLRSLSDAARRKEAWRLGVGYEFVARPDGLKGLLQTYGLQLAGAPATMDLGLLYPALESGRIEMGAASATDGALASGSFQILNDDRKYFPPYECAVVARQETLDRYPELGASLRALENQIDDQSMRRLNAAIDRDHRSAVDVAREFLRKIP